MSLFIGPVTGPLAVGTLLTLCWWPGGHQLKMAAGRSGCSFLSSLPKRKNKHIFQSGIQHREAVPWEREEGKRNGALAETKLRSCGPRNRQKFSKRVVGVSSRLKQGGAGWGGAGLLGWGRVGRTAVLGGFQSLAEGSLPSRRTGCGGEGEGSGNQPGVSLSPTDSIPPCVCEWGGAPNPFASSQGF